MTCRTDTLLVCVKCERPLSGEAFPVYADGRRSHKCWRCVPPNGRLARRLAEGNHDPLARRRSAVRAAAIAADPDGERRAVVRRIVAQTMD